jgi:hypothetical protein
MNRNIMRTSIFSSNVAKIERHNNKSLSWKLAANNFADMSAQEFTNAYLSGYRPRTASRPNLRVAVPAPSNDNFEGYDHDTDSNDELCNKEFSCCHSPVFSNNLVCFLFLQSCVVQKMPCPNSRTTGGRC